MLNYFLTITSATHGYSVTSIFASTFEMAVDQAAQYLNDKFGIEPWYESGNDIKTRQHFARGEKSTGYESDPVSVWVYFNQSKNITASLLPDLHHT